MNSLNKRSYVEKNTINKVFSKYARMSSYVKNLKPDAFSKYVV